MSGPVVAGRADGSANVLLFDRDRVEEVQDWAQEVGRLRSSSILWIDLDRPGEETIAELAEVFELDRESVDRLANPPGIPFVGDFGAYFHVTAYAPAKGTVMSHELERVGCLVSDRWVVTIHDGRIPVLDSFRERAEGHGETGRLDGLEFLANLLEWVLEGYLDAFEEIEVALEDIDSRAMVDTLEEPEAALQQLVDLRREIGRLRRAIVSHRRMFLSLTRPELGGMSTSESAERFADLRTRLEEVVQAARDSRDSVVGSFDVLIARTGHRTNEIMKVLTLASVLLLPGSLIAGLMGMNFRIGLFEHTWLFWMILAAIGALAALTLGVARKQRWI
jgi:magnesium transporter